jgi:hypothetical protein
MGAGDRCIRLLGVGWLTSGVQLQFNFLEIFEPLNFEIRNSDFSVVQNSHKFSGRKFETKGTTFLFGPTSNSLRIASYKFWNKFNFESSSNFKGVQTFRKKLKNSLKFHLLMIYLNIILH